jgi:FAD binding domain/Berberine and berberine like
MLPSDAPKRVQPKKEATMKNRNSLAVVRGGRSVDGVGHRVVRDELATLQARITGEVLTAESPAYDEARKVQIFVDRHPALIVRAANANDIAETVRFAGRHQRPLAVRSGGHSVPRLSMVDGEIVADLSRMTAISIDPVRRIARAQAGATSGDLAGPANAHGLALTTGDTASVGLGGLTTGGGVGFMVRKYGLTIDNLLSAQVVTADGEIRTASPDQNPDLFWAIRGGGGNFGVVTEFEFQMAPVGDVLAGALVLPATHEVIRGYLDYVTTAPDDLTTLADLIQAPPAPFIPEDRIGQPVFSILTCWTGDFAEGVKALEPLRTLAKPVADTIAPIPYPNIYEYTAHLMQRHGVSLRMMFADELSDAAIDASLDAVENTTAPVSLVQIRGLGGAMARVPKGDTAFAHRDKRYFYAVISAWFDQEEDAGPHESWTHSLWNKVRHEGSGVYVNFLEEEGENRIREAYPAATHARLAEIKQKYDPDNVFRFNQNVAPASERASEIDQTVFEATA